ncbi:conserved hypothetical protein [Alkaliphilus metalliredigens QYMF]|uniref:Tocopherol cyclase n=1 Tax=Alkaliphilus metalliredigens (strain QYMF) TaxID=293826 RepID=A6TTR9_ALKMQ|nr:tocopherol cyclase family protein [Alkaliphilus metalliredigens]ABR49587.1 conserved hypothetical protein [Alkaliphilus metalliredigens QYMF]
MYGVNKIWKPEIFQGKYKKRNYFEGWYFKLINAHQDQVFGVIPGISYGSTPQDAHAFIQVLDGIACQSHYFPYPSDAFKFSQNKFEVRIGQNAFSRDRMILSLENKETKVEGELHFSNIVPFPSTLINPGIMGPFSFIPSMECYHGIVNIHHDTMGSLTVGDQKLNFDHGYGYIEKDWGQSFPEAYIWLQSNHFSREDVSIMFSIAKIPWLGKHFIGHISFLRIGETFYRFATYTGAKLISLVVTDQGIEVILQDKHHRLVITAISSKSSMLKAPQKGLMNREILESITAQVQVLLTDPKGTVIFQGEGVNTGLEMVGDLSILFLC